MRKHSIIFQIFITLLTVCSLFMEDIRVIFIDKSSDSIIDGLNIAFIIIFMVEIILSFSIPGYAWSFFFFLDVLSTLSITLDISLLTNLMYSSDGGSTQQLNMIIRNSKASRAAARTVRVMKIFRLARIVKLYKSALKTKELNQKKQQELRRQKLKAMKLKKIKEAMKDDQDDRELTQSNFQENLFPKIAIMTKLDAINEEEEEMSEGKKNQQLNSIHEHLSTKIQQQAKNEEPDSPPASQQSQISKMLSDSTMKKIIIVILFLMFSVPALEISNYYQQTNAWDFLAEFVSAALEQPSIPLQKINKAITRTIEDTKKLDTKEQLIIFRTPFDQLYNFDSGTLDTLRITDIAISEAQLNVDLIIQNRPELTLNSERTAVIQIVLNSRQFNKLDSWFSILKILFICFVIIYLLNTFNGIISELITQPIEKMLEQVKNQGKKAPDLDQEEHPAEVLSQKLDNNYQTVVVHKAITKISNMIQKIFGESGRELIYQRIFDQGTVVNNYLSSGQRHFCILGLCTIENFTLIRQTIGSEATTLANQIAEYLHSAVYRYGGNAITNYDSSFLVAFKCPAAHQPEDNSYQHFNSPNQAFMNILTDFSVYAMTKTIVKINKESKFYKYRKDSRLLQNFGQMFQVRIVCNLHAGWITEAFLGSSIKMDLSQIGSPIKQLKSIARYTKKCGNNIFMSETVYDLLTHGLRRNIRVMEKFKNKQSGFESVLYRVDLNLQNISLPKGKSLKKGHSHESVSSSIHLKKELNFQVLKNAQEIGDYKASVFIASKKELREVMRHVIGEQYYKKYRVAYQLFESEEWFECRQILQELLSFNKQDPLVLRLLQQIGDDPVKKSKYLQF